MMDTAGLDALVLDWLTTYVTECVNAEQAAAPTALSFLLRRYEATGAASLQDAIERGLARALERVEQLEDIEEWAKWLSVYAQAARLSDTAELRTAADDLAARLRHAESSGGAPDLRMRAIAACLQATTCVDPRVVVPQAIDELEALIASVYRPGEGLRGIAPGGQVVTASALLTAYAATDRLPYAMLAEEIMQSLQRAGWESGLTFPESCEAARVLIQLAALRADSEYDRAALTAGDPQYAAAAASILAANRNGLGERGQQAAHFGLALDDLLRFVADLK